MIKLIKNLLALAAVILLWPVLVIIATVQRVKELRRE